MKEQHKKESPVLSLLGMGGGGTGVALGGGLALPKTYVDDVFSTFLYTGTGSAQVINNGLNLGAPAAVSLNGKTITDTTGGGADYTKLNNNIISSANSDYYYGAIDCYIDYGSAVVSTFYDLYPQGDNSQNPKTLYNTPQSVTAYGSNNASSWTELGTSTFESYSWSEGKATKFVFENLIAYRYYRLTVAGTKALQEWRLGLGQAGKGGLTWVKYRAGTFGNGSYLYDTVRGNASIQSNASSAEVYPDDRLTFHTNGFNALNTGGAAVNASGYDYASWSFRQAPGFFDIVRYTGNQTAGRSINHNLGSVPGMIMVKDMSRGEGWMIYHRSRGKNKWLQLNTTSAENPDSQGDMWGNVTPTSTNFYLGNSSNTNHNGDNYIAYIFAHDEPVFGTSGNESIIKCGSYTGNGSTDGPEINLGFEPQWIMIKRATGGTGSWFMFDNMRGMAIAGHDGGGNDTYLQANESDAEDASAQFFDISSTGWKTVRDWGLTNASGSTYIYMAIRRPNKPPTVATEVFNVATRVTPAPAYRSAFPVDMAMRVNSKQSNHFTSISGRLTQKRLMDTNAPEAEQDGNEYMYDYMNGWNDNPSNDTNSISWMFKRAPGFFDTTHWTGDGTSNGSFVVTHNLGAVPEFMMMKSRSSSNRWCCYHTGLSDNTKQIYLNLSQGEGAVGELVRTSTSFKPTLTGNADYSSNTSGVNYIAYLFATKSGISKVGSYTGTGNAINVPCGFTNGARFILIKRRDDNGDWYFWDSVRGIVSGNDPYLLLNAVTGEVTNTDYVDPLTSGFTVTASAPAALNASGGTYIFLAIA